MTNRRSGWHDMKDDTERITGVDHRSGFTDQRGANQRHKMRTWESAGFRKQQENQNESLVLLAIHRQQEPNVRQCQYDHRYTDNEQQEADSATVAHRAT
jgi:hypothetical protein